MTIIFKIIFIYILKKILFVEATPYYGQKQWNLSNTKGRYNDFNHDEEMVHLSTTPSTNYTINAFGRTIHLSLKPNTLLMPFKTQIVDENKSYDLPYLEKPCHYLHRSKRGLKPEGITAAISFCQPNIVTGFIITEDITFEISPLPQNENYPSHQIYDLLAMANAVYENNNAKEYIPHLIKKASLPPNFSLFEDNIYIPNFSDYHHLQYMKRPSLMTESSKVEKNDGKHLILEAAMFFDEAGYKLFAPYLKNDYHRLRNMLLAYMNGVQALYHHPSIGQRLDIALVRLEIFKTQPSDLPTYNGERTELLNSFCNFNGKHNPSGDSNPGHWDIGLYISGLDFYAVEGGRRSDITMGLSAVGGVCMEKYSCVIAEFGTTNTFGKPYPSAGFSSVYVLAHEIGHNLGMHHDGSMNNCPKDGYVMSPSRSVTGGETHWSSCSAEIMKKLWSNPCLKDSPEGKIIERQKQGGDTPGVMWNAKKQCEILLRDKDANPIKKLNSRSDNNNDMCQNLECDTPHRTGRYYAGPALDGTMCARDKWCIAGECVKKNSKLKQIAIKGDWSKWTEEKCTSGCILKSKGYQLKSRTCDNPEPINTDEGCEGLAFEIKLCSDESICKNVKRESAVDYATKKCSKFSKFLKQIDGAGSGLQAPHEPGRIWVACTIFCKIKEKSGPSSYYAPRVEFNDFNIDPYFPDGTWCHNDEKQNYYCQQHKCLPQDSQITSRTVSEDLHDLVQNAWPYVKVSDTPTTADFKNYELKQNEIIRYLSLDGSGQPLLKNLPDDPFPVPGEEDWSDHDYLDLNS